MTTPLSPSTKVFSPVKFADRPCLSKNINLTGTPRKIKDNVAEMFNGIQKWNNFHADGAAILRKIANYLPLNNKMERASCKLLPSFELLQEILVKMATLVRGFEIIRSQFISLEKLSGAGGDPVFLTWPLSNFIALSERLHLSYKNQLALNERIVENVAFSSQRSANVSIDIWLYQPCVNEIISFEIDCALKETGFA